MADLTYEMFAPHLGSTFQLLVDGQAPLILELAEVENLSPENHDPQDPGSREPFSLIFHGPLRPVVPQQIVPLEHAQLGRLEMFLVPLGPERKLPQKMRYQAIFN
ncbi:MAG: hypothetical protein AABP62_29015 [Planctomycetota bacterium]